MALNADRLGAALQAADEGALADAPGFKTWLASLSDDNKKMRTASYKAMAQAIIDEIKDNAIVSTTGTASAQTGTVA